MLKYIDSNNDRFSLANFFRILNLPPNHQHISKIVTNGPDVPNVILRAQPDNLLPLAVLT